MTKEERAEFKSKIAEMIINRQKSKEELKNIQRQNGDDFDIRKLLKQPFYVSRWKARHIMLAYAMLKNTPYKKVETTCREVPSWGLISKYSGKSIDYVDAWIQNDEKIILNAKENL